MPVGPVREFLQVTKESAYGTPKTTPTAGTDVIPIRLGGANQFTMRPNPVVVPVMYGGGLNVEAETISDKTELRGSLQTELTYSQAALLLGAALIPINSGQTAPWVTTEPPGQMASLTIDHAIVYEDTGAVKRTRYTGVKVDAGSIQASEESQKIMLQLDLIGSKYDGNTFDVSSDPNSTVFPLPEDDDYPTDFVTFIHSADGLLIDTVGFVPYTSLNFSWQRNHDSRFYASRWIQLLRTYGRKFTLESGVTLVASPDLRAAFQTLAAKEVTLAFTDGTTTLNFDFKAHARIEGLEDDLQLGQIYQRTLTIGSRNDAAAGSDFEFSIEVAEPPGG